MTDGVYAGAEYHKSERKPVYKEEVGGKPLARPPLPRVDLNQVRRNYSRSGLNPSAEPWHPGPPRTATSGANLLGSQQLQQVLGQQHEAVKMMADSLQQALKMPKRELLTFDGNPLSYWLFVNNFEVNIAKRVRDAESRLTYLIQLCTGKAREAIKNCAIISPPEQDYEKAKEILYHRFGRKHVIAHAHIAKIVDGLQLRATDVVGLSDLSVEMQNCALILVQMGYEADINSSDKLVKIMRRLPVHLQSKWADTAGQLTLRGVEPTFSHLAKFVEERAMLVNTMYGEFVGSSQEKERRIKQQSKKKPLTTEAKGRSLQRKLEPEMDLIQTLILPFLVVLCVLVNTGLRSVNV